MDKAHITPANEATFGVIFSPKWLVLIPPMALSSYRNYFAFSTESDFSTDFDHFKNRPLGSWGSGRTQMQSHKSGRASP